MTEMTSLRLDAEQGPPNQLLPELAELLQGRSVDDQRTILRLLDRSLTRMPYVEPLGEMAIIHGALKADALAVSHEELQSVKAPPTMKLYPGSPQFPLPVEPLPLEHTLEKVIRARASRRDYGEEPLTIDQVGTLLHYSFGVRKHLAAYNRRDFPVRYAPSSGGLQSNELYLIVNSVEGLPQGLFHYAAEGHCLELLNEGNMRRKLVTFAQRQEWLQYAGIVFVLTGVRGRVEWKYGTRSHSYMHMDAGFIGEHIYLVATALGLRTSAIAGFSEDAMNDLLGVDGLDEFVLLLFPVGSKPPGHFKGAGARLNPEALDPGPP